MIIRLLQMTGTVGTVFTSFLGVGISLAAEKSPMHFYVGEQRLQTWTDLSRYAIGDPSLIRAVPAPAGTSRDQVLLKAVRAGTTDVWVFRAGQPPEHRLIRIDAGWNGGLPAGLERALGELETCEVIATPGAVTLRGTLTRESDVARIKALLSSQPQSIRNETIPAEAVLQEGSKKVQAWLEASGLTQSLRLERKGHSLWLRGTLDRPGDRSTLQQQASAAYPGIEFDLDSLPDAAPTIHFKVFLMEAKKNRSSRLGVQWPDVVSGAFQITPWAIVPGFNIEQAIEALEGEGSVKILSNPELVVRAPGEAELFAGGEVPIRERNNHTYAIKWRPYGLNLKLKVTSAAGDRIRLEVHTEVSQIDAKHAIEDAPGIQANRIHTQVDARLGVPLLLSGLLQEGTQESGRGLPALRGIPVLGSLFGTEERVHERAELVAVLLPFSAPPPTSGVWDGAPMQENRRLGHVSEPTPPAQATGAEAPPSDAWRFNQPPAIVINPVGPL